MSAIWVAPVKTPVSAEHLSRAYRTVLTRLIGAPSDMAVAVLHAHCALETGHTKSCYNFNLKNIKHGRNREGLYTTIKLNEVLNGRTVWFAPEGELEGKDGPIRKGTESTVPPGHPQTRMRAYDSLAGAADEQVRFFMAERWRPALDFALEGNPAAYVDAIRARGYFTAALEPYKRAVVSLTQTYYPVAIATREASGVPPIPPDSDELCRDIAACHRFELPPELAARVRVHQAEHIDFALDLVRAARDEELKNGGE